MKQCGDEDNALRQGAESRQQNFKQHISEQLILQIYQKNNKESNENNPDTPQSYLDGHFFDKPSKKYTESPSQLKDVLKNPPNTFPMSEIVLPHKLSDSISLVATPNIIGGASVILQGKSPSIQTQSTQMIKLIKRNESSQQLHTSSLNEEDGHLFHLPLSYEEEDPQIQENKVETSGKTSNCNVTGPGILGTRKQLAEASFSGFAGTAQQTVPLMNSTLCDNLNDQSNYGIVLKQPVKYEQSESQDLNKPNDTKLRSDLKTQSNRIISRINNSTLTNNSPQCKSGNSQLVSDFIKNFKIMNHVKLFVSKLKNFTVQSNFQDLTQKHYDLIGDVSAYFHTRQLPSSQGDILNPKLSRQISRNIKELKYFDSFRRDTSEVAATKDYKIRKITDIVIHMIKSIPVFDTNSFFFIFWDMFMLLIQITVFFAIPLCLSFNLTWDFINSQGGGEIQQILIGIFLIDTAITLNRGVYISGAVVMERNVIFQEYKKNVLFTDIGTIISLLNINKYFQFLIFIRLKYAISITNRLDDHFQIRMRYPNFMKFVFMLSSIILVAHFCACLLYLVSRLSLELGDSKESMLTSDHFLETPLSSQYVNCLYVTLITMSTVGYGDIVPLNSYEKMYTMVMTMISSATFGYVVNTVGQIFTTISQRSASFDQKKFEITTYMNTRGIPKQIQMKAIKYLEYTQLSNRNNHLKGEIILSQLPNQLTQEIKEEFFGKILQNCKLIQSNFSEIAIKNIAQKMKEISLAPGQFLFQGEQKDHRIYFLLEGSLSVHVQKQNGKLLKIASITEKNAIIGQRSFFCEQIRSKWIKCEQSSNLAYIELQDFKDSLLHFPIDYEVFCYMKDTIRFEGKTADTPCASCNKFQHNFQECPLLHLRQNKIKVIYSNLYSIPQERQKSSSIFRSEKKQPFQSLKNNQSIRMKLRQLRVDKIKEQLEELQKEDKKSLNVTINNINEGTASKNYDIDYEEEIKAYELLLSVKSDRKFLKNVPSIEISDEEGEEDGSDGNQAFPDLIIDEYHDPNYDEDDDKSDAISQSSSEQTLEISDRTKKLLEQPSKIGINNSKGDGIIIEESSQNLKDIDRSSSDHSNMLSASSKPDHFSTCQIRPTKISKTSQIEDIINEMRGQRQSATRDEVLTGQFQTNSQISVTQPQADNNTNSNNNQLTLFGRQGSTSSNNLLGPTIPILPLPMVKDKDILINNNPSTNKNSNNYGGNTSHQAGFNQSFSTAFNYASLTHNDNILNTPRNTALQSMFSNEQILKVLRKALSNQTTKQSSALNKRLSFQSSSVPKSKVGKSFFQEKQKLEQTKTGEINSSVVSDKLKALLFKQNSQVQNNLAENIQERELLQQQMIQDIIRKHQELFFYDFETAKKMVKYYPKQNMLNVVVSFNRVMKLRIKKNGMKNIMNVQKSLSIPNQERNSIKMISPLKRLKDKGREHTENQYIPTSSLYKNKLKKMSIMQSNS